MCVKCLCFSRQKTNKANSSSERMKNRASPLSIPTRFRRRREENQSSVEVITAADGDDDIAQTYTESIVWYGPRSIADKRRTSGPSKTTGVSASQLITPPTYTERIVDSTLRSDEGVMHEGRLWKLGGKVKNWKKRHFVLRSSPNILEYYRINSSGSRNKNGIKENERYAVNGSMTLKGRIHLVRGMSVGDAPELTGRANAFKVIHDQRTWYFQADNAPSKDEWIMKIQRQLRKLESQYSSAAHNIQVQSQHLEERQNRNSELQGITRSQPTSQLREQLTILTDLEHLFRAEDASNIDGSYTPSGPEEMVIRDEVHRMLQTTRRIITPQSPASLLRDGESVLRHPYYHLPVSARCCVDIQQDLLIKIPICGHLYLLERFILFYCSFFGTITQYVIPLDLISSVQLTRIEGDDGSTLHSLRIQTIKGIASTKKKHITSENGLSDRAASTAFPQKLTIVRRNASSRRYYFYLNASSNQLHDSTADDDDDPNKVANVFTDRDADQLHKLVRLLRFQLTHLGITARFLIPKKNHVIAERHFALKSPPSPLLQTSSDISPNLTPRTSVGSNQSIQPDDGASDEDTSDILSLPSLSPNTPRKENEAFSLSSFVTTQEFNIHKDFKSTFSKLHMKLFDQPIPETERLMWRFFCLYRDFRGTTKKNLWGSCYISTSFVCFRGWLDMFQEEQDNFAALSGHGTWDKLDRNYSKKRRKTVSWILHYDDIRLINLLVTNGTFGTEATGTNSTADDSVNIPSETVEFVLSNGVRHFITLFPTSYVLDNNIKQCHELGDEFTFRGSQRVDLTLLELYNMQHVYATNDDRIRRTLRLLRDCYCHYKNIPIPIEENVKSRSYRQLDLLDIPDRAESMRLVTEKRQHTSTLTSPLSPTTTTTTTSHTFDIENTMLKSSAECITDDLQSITDISCEMTCSSVDGMETCKTQTDDQPGRSMDETESSFDYHAENDGTDNSTCHHSKDATKREMGEETESLEVPISDNESSEENCNSCVKENDEDEDTSSDLDNPETADTSEDTDTSFIISDYFQDQLRFPASSTEFNSDHRNVEEVNRARGSSIFHRLSFRSLKHLSDISQELESSDPMTDSPTLADDDPLMPKLMVFPGIQTKRSTFNMLSKKHSLVIRQNVQSGEMLLQLVQINGEVSETRFLSQMRLVLLGSTSEFVLHVKFMDNTDWKLYCRSTTQRDHISKFLTTLRRQSE